MSLYLRAMLGLALFVVVKLTNGAEDRGTKTDMNFNEPLRDSESTIGASIATAGSAVDKADSLDWPWDKKNKTHEDTSCSTHLNCDECTTSSSFCHWCSFDHACHAKGSIHGCLEGVTCQAPAKENSTCASRTSCSDCAHSSSLCHWCAHDNMCHAVGSIYGCVTGVDCYSNDRCQRFVPEDITGYFIQDVGILPLAIIFSLGLCCCCCASLCFCGASGIKGAYDDIVVVAGGGIEPDPYEERMMVRYARPPSAILTPTIHERENEDGEDDDMSGQIINIGSGDSGPDQAFHDIAEEAALLESHLDLHADGDYTLMSEAVSAQPSAYATVQARGGSNSMQRIFNICRLCYFLTLIGIGGFVLCSIRYFPKVPTYNVCNDNLAWKSIVDNMTSLKAEATFEILISVLNPNHFGVAVDMGKGTFNHRGVFVGTFDIPPTTVPSMSLMDIRVVAHFTPEKWEALSLTAEYYKGTLAFDVDAKATFRFPWLFDYSTSSSFNDIHVLVNDPKLNDRHLCACPKWSDAKNKTAGDEVAIM
jgi:hypothetical protein